MVKEDIYKLDRTLDKEKERNLLKLFSDDQKDVKRFIDDFEALGYSTARIIKYLHTLVSIRKRLNIPFKKVTEDEIKIFFGQLEKSDYAEWTKHDFKVILRKYLQWSGRGDIISWMKIKVVKNGKMPEEVLTEVEIKRLAEAAYTTRDKAIIISLYESGCRIGEFLPMKIKHLSFDKYGVSFRVTGKTGDRRIRLVASTLNLQAWLNEHPLKGDPEAYLWCKIPSKYNPKWKNDHLTHRFIVKLFDELAAKAEVKKGVNPHAFRHSRATFMAKHLKEPEMREFFGWSKDSEMPAIYVHLSGRDVDNSVLAVYGIKEAAQSSEPIIKTWSCMRCNEANDPASKFCKKCGLPVDAGNVDKIEGLLVEFLDIIAEAFPQVKTKFREVVERRGAEGLFFR